MIVSKRVESNLEDYMKAALEQAQLAMTMDEVPIGAVIVYKNEVIVKEHNLVEKTKDPTAHAEIIALRKASEILKTNKLTEIELYVTLEPCVMCAGAILQSRIKRLIFGAYDGKLGAVGSLIDVIRTPFYKTNTEVIGGIMQKECSALLKSFFEVKR